LAIGTGLTMHLFASFIM